MISSSQSSSSRAGRTAREELEQRLDVAGVELGGVLGHGGREVEGRGDDDAARLHRVRGLRGHQLRRRAPRHERCGDDHVRARDLGRQGVALRLLLVLRQLARVAAGRLRVGGPRDLEELRPERLHLLLDRRAHVEGRHHGAEPAGGGDRLQAGHARPEHEHLRRRDGAGSGHQHGEEAAHLLRGDQHRAVAGHARLGGERVHRLRTRDARDRLHREPRRARRGERPDPRPVRERGKEADHDRLWPQRAHLLVARRRDLRDDVPPPRRAEARAGRLEELVRDAGRGAGSGLDDDVMALGGELAHEVRDERHAPLAAHDLLRNPDLHRRGRYPTPQRGALLIARTRGRGSPRGPARAGTPCRPAPRAPGR